jgi:RNA polymerase sigma-70 factor (ECF subfamily)
MRGFQREELGQPVSEREKRWRVYLGQIAGGDAESLARLYDECAAALFGLALKTMKNEADAEEIILEVFEQVWRTAHSFDPARGSAWRWLSVMLRSRTLDRLRSATAKRDRQHLAMPENWDLASQDRLPDHATIFDQERKLIRSALQRLRGEQRQAVELA